MDLERIGWGGVFGAQMKNYNLMLYEKNKYKLKFDIVSYYIDKWVFVELLKKEDSASVIWYKWLHLKKGVNQHIEEEIDIQDSDYYSLYFGLGGEFGDREDEMNRGMYDSLNELPYDNDPAYSTLIACYNISLVNKNDETTVPTTSEILTSMVTEQSQQTTDSSVAIPTKVMVKKVVSVKGKKVKVSLKKLNDVKGYEIQYSLKKNFKPTKKIRTTKRVYTISKLKKAKTYYVRVRAYKVDGRKTFYGEWSKVKKLKVK